MPTPKQKLILPGKQSSLLLDLVSFWTLDEQSGNALDLVGSNNLTPTNNPLGVAGKQEKARNFVRASSQKLAINANAGFAQDKGFSVALWVKPTSFPATQYVVGKYELTGNQKSHLMQISNAGTAGAFFSSDGLAAVNIGAGNALIAGQWNFVVYWFDPVLQRGFIQANGGNVYQTATIASVFVSTAPFQISGAFGSNFLDGAVDNVGYWKRPLTANERATIFNKGVGLPYPF